MRAPNDSSSSTDCTFVFVLLGEERNATTLTFKCFLFMSLFSCIYIMCLNTGLLY